MSGLEERLARLSPTQRALFEQRLREKKRARQAQAEVAPQGSAPSSEPIPPRPRDEPAPLSVDQDRIFFIHQLNPESPFYNIYECARFRGRLDVGLLNRALNAIVARHEVLRTRYTVRDGRTVQLVEERLDVALTEVDLQGLPPERARVEGDRQVACFLSTPFDLERLPLCRSMQVHLPDDEHLWPVVYHHLVIDWVSTFLFQKELVAFYRAFSEDPHRDPAKVLPPLRLQYADWAAWQRRQLDSESLSAQVAWWKEKLEGVPQSTEIPIDHPRPALASGRGGRFYFKISPHAARAMRPLAQRSGVTLFMAYLALFKVLTLRLSGQERLVVGSPVVSRNHPDLDDLIGFFLHQLIFDTDLGADPQVPEALRRVRESSVGAFSHKDVPFGQVVELVRPERDLGRMPLTQLTFLFLNPHQLDPERFPDVEYLPYEFDGESSKFDITWVLWDREDGTADGLVEYNADLFDRSTVRRLAAWFSHLVESATEAPLHRLSQLRLLGHGERHQLLHGWNDSDTQLPTGFLDPFDETVARCPERVALTCGDRGMTYGEVGQGVARIVRRLRERGVGPEVLVGVFLGRSELLPMALLGVMGAGGAYVPLEPSTPPARLRQILEEAAPRLILSEAALAEEVAELGQHDVVWLDEWMAETSREVVTRVEAGDIPGDRLAYVLFTSGSTGRPKGVQIVHRALSNFLAGFRERVGLGEADSLVATTTPTFDISVVELLLPWLSGGRVSVAGSEEVREPSRLVDLMARLRPTVHQATPAGWRQLLDAGLPLSIAPRRFCGGEALPPDLAETLGRDGEIWNLYGPTETTIYSAGRQVEDGERPVRVGGAWTNTRLFVSDRRGMPAALGAPGELVIAGDGLARGYRSQPAKTAEGFVPAPAVLGLPAGSRLYRSGDLVRRLPKGDMQFLGRIDHQVKLRGFRIELGEVESWLLDHRTVGSAAAAIRDGLLLAYLVAEGEPVSSEEIQAFLRHRLPDYMVPSAVLWLDALPKTSSGKVDRKALPSPRLGGRAFVAPRTPVEDMLATVWREVLEVERVGVRDHFFELGGHSLLATRLLARVRAVCGVDLPMRTVFDAPTLEEQARKVAEARFASESTSKMPPLHAGQVDTPWPLSFAQERLWFLDRLHPGSVAYNLPAWLRFRGSLDLQALERGLATVLQRHPVLRARLVDRGEGPVAEVVPDVAFAMSRTDLSSLPEDRREGEARRRIQGFVGQGFDLAQDLLLRALMVRLGEDHHQLVLVVHHIAADGWSMGRIVQEMTACYRLGAVDLPEPVVTYGDFAHWQRSWLQGEPLEQEVAFWRDHLEGVPTLELPTDRPRGSESQRHGAILPVELGSELSQGIDRLAGSGHGTQFTVLVALFSAMLGRLAGRSTVALGTPVAGRRRLELEDLVGLFVNTLVLRMDLGGDPRVEDLLGRSRREALEADAHQDVPFEKVVAELDPQRDPTVTPLFQVVLVLQNQPQDTLALPGVEVEALPVSSGEAKFDLTLSLAPEPDGLRGLLEYDRDLFDHTTVQRWWKLFQRLVATAIDEPQSRISSWPWWSHSERQQMLREWNDTDQELSTPPHLAVLFERRAARVPEAVAVVGEAASVGEMAVHLTFGALARGAGMCADHLQALGVGPEVMVGICGERGPALVTALLGVVRSGGAYFPLDPTLPVDRWKLLVEEAQLGVVLLQDSVAERFPEEGALTGGPTRQTWQQDASGRLAFRSTSGSANRSEDAFRGEHLAYAMATSGSTGRPKTVMATHRAVVRLVEQANFADLEAEQTFLQNAPTSFDAATLELWAPLLRGGRMVLAPAHPMSLEETAALVARQRVTTLWLTAGIFHPMVDGPLAEMRSLRQLLAGGDAIQPGAVARAQELLPDCRVINGYGPTENTTFTACHGEGPRNGDMPVGRPITNTKIQILDRDFRPVPWGSVGELCTSGAGLARGYRGRPARTAESFVPDPSGVFGGRLYRTGDRARYGTEGSLFFLGRLDDQVKIRGFRVEPRELQSALEALVGVQRAVVVVGTEVSGDKALRAAVVPVVGAVLDVDDLQQALRSRLPTYLLPTSLVVMEALPVNPNGKVDRAEVLRRIEAEEGVRTVTASRGADSPLEELIAGQMSELLGEVVGPEDDFFALGGHSLLATRLASSLRRLVGLEIPLRDLFEASTPRALARLATSAKEDPLPPVQVQERSKESSWPLSFAQERLWILDRLEPGNAAYNMPFALRLRGDLDLSALEQAMAFLAQRHEGLRTTFHSVDGSAVQRLGSSQRTFTLPQVDVSWLEEVLRGDVVDGILSQSSLQPFHLDRGPLFRPLLVHRGEGDYVLLLTLHHIICDGWSMGILSRHLGEIYDALVDGTDPSVEGLPLQYVDYAVWQRQWLRGEERRHQTDYWREQLHGLPPALELPTDRPRPAVRRFRGGRLERRLGPELSRALKVLGQQRGATLFMVLLAGFSLLLRRLSGQTDFAIGTPVAGRRQAEVESLVGIFLNTLVLRCRPVDGESFEVWLNEVRETTLEAYGHQDLPFEALLDVLEPERDLSRTPLFQVFFNMLNLSLEPTRLRDLTLEPMVMPELPTKFDITLYVAEVEEEIDLLFVYDASLFSARRMEEMARQYASLLEQAVAQPAARLAKFDLALEQADPGEPTVLPNPEEVLDSTWQGSVVHWVATRAAVEPEKIAVEDPTGSWTYAQLLDQSRRLAWKLRACGVERGSVVAIQAHRSSSLVWSVLGVLEVGAAFLLLDPSYPEAHRMRLVRLAQPSAFLSMEATEDLSADFAACLVDLGCAQLEIPIWSPDGTVEAFADQPTKSLGIELSPEDLAAVGFTSGSTGEPKGILGRHGPLTHFLPWQRDHFGLTQDDRYSLLSGLAHDPLQRDLFTPLCLGATLVIPDPDRLFEAGAIADWLRREQITIAHLTPAMARLAVEGEPEPLPDLRRVFLTGDVLTRRDVLALGRLAPEVECVNFYGSTETQRAVGCCEVDPVDLSDDGPEIQPLGRGVADVQLWVMGPGGRPAGVGELGEVWVRSPHLARGYLGLPGLTADRFRPDAGGERMYRTGDVGRYLPDGQVVFVGRADRQVQIRGFRVEPGEVEGVFCRLPSVREAVVLAHGEDERKQLTAFVVAEPTAAHEARGLRREVRDHLPAHLVPSEVHFLEALPLTPNGKLDRKKLLGLAHRHRSTQAGTAPRSYLERSLVALLEEILGREAVGVDDNFFDLGGNSLLLVRFHGRLEQLLGRSFPALEIFQNPTVATLAAHLEGAEGSPGTTSQGPRPSRRRQLARQRDRRRHRGGDR